MLFNKLKRSFPFFHLTTKIKSSIKWLFTSTERSFSRTENSVAESVVANINQVEYFQTSQEEPDVQINYLERNILDIQHRLYDQTLINKREKG